MLRILKNKFLVLVVMLFGSLAFCMREEAAQIEDESSEYEGSAIKFHAAEFTGEDNEGKEYMVRAREAQSSDQDIYLLTDVEMSYDFENRGDLTLSSNEGNYNRRMQVFVALGNVKIGLQNKYFVFTNKLLLKLYDGIIYTDEQVLVEGNGLIVRSTNGVSVDTKKKIIDYHGPIYSKFVDS